MSYNENGICKFAIEREDSHSLQLVARINVDDLVKLFDEAPTNFDGENPVCKVKDPIKFTEFVIRRLWDDAPYEADDVVWAQPLTYIFEELLEDYKPEFLEYFEEVWGIWLKYLQQTVTAKLNLLKMN